MSFGKLWFLLIVYAFIFQGCAKAQNLALHKSYTISAKPNYDLSAPPSDSTSLTDGIYSSSGKTFWTQKTTVGWKWKEFVKVTIDLGKKQPVGSVSLSTAKRRNTDVYYPWGIYVFLSNDQHGYFYEGKAYLQKSTVEKKDKRGLFELNNIDKSARYVTIAVAPRGKNHFLFFDEIEVNKGGWLAGELSGHNISRQNIRYVVDSLRSVENPMIQFISIFKNSDQAKKDIKLFSQGSSTKDVASMDITKLKDVQSKVLKQRAAQLQARLQTSFIAEKYNPWTELPVNVVPNQNVDSLSYDKVILKGGSVYGAFILSNLDSKQQIFQFKSPVSRAFSFYRVDYIGSKYKTRIADPLVPVSISDTLQPGVSQLYLFSLNNIQSDSTLHFNIASPQKRLTARIHTQVIDKTPQFQLNAVNWGYLTYPMLRDIKKEAIKDMKKHHINTFVVPPSAIPNLNSQDFEPFKQYLGYLPKDSKVFLFMNYKYSTTRLGSKGTPFMSDTWKKMFGDWYQKVVSIAQNVGFSASNIYLYPYDEVKKNKNIRDFQRFARWAKGNLSNLQLYATITNKKAADALYNYLDIAQFFIGSGLYSKYKRRGTENWVYSILGSSRSLSPYRYYRLLAWKAFLYDVEGIGFWNYAGNEQKTFINTAGFNVPRDYTAIYNSKSHDIISSRRWEAFKLGMEDYKVLKLHEIFFGKRQTGKLVKSVVNNPNNVVKAAEVRRSMLNKIKEK